MLGVGHVPPPDVPPPPKKFERFFVKTLLGLTKLHIVLIGSLNLGGGRVGGGGGCIVTPSYWYDIL